MKNSMAMSRQTYGRACKKKGHVQIQLTVLHKTRMKSLQIGITPRNIILIFLHSASLLICPSFTNLILHTRRADLYDFTFLFTARARAISLTLHTSLSAIYIVERNRGTFVVIKLLPFNTLQTLSIFIGLKSTPC